MLHTFLKFNESVTSTNLWKPTKSAGAFRLDPTVFLKDHHLAEVRGLFLSLLALHVAQDAPSPVLIMYCMVAHAYSCRK